MQSYDAAVLQLIWTMSAVQANFEQGLPRLDVAVVILLAGTKKPNDFMKHWSSTPEVLSRSLGQIWNLLRNSNMCSNTS